MKKLNLMCYRVKYSNTNGLFQLEFSNGTRLSEENQRRVRKMVINYLVNEGFVEFDKKSLDS